MYKHILILFIALISVVNSKACDVCGSSSIGNTNLYSLTNQKMIGINYSYSTSNYVDSKYSDFDYTTSKQAVIINSLWTIIKSLQVESNIPYEFNLRAYSDRNESIVSIGDVQVGLNHFYQFGKDSSWILKSSLLTEFSLVKFSEEVKSMGLQPTSRSIDGLFSLGVLKKWNRFGIFINNRFKMSLIDFSDYHFGNTIANGLSVNYSLPIKSYTSILQGGISRDYKMYDIENGLKQHGTSMDILYANLGLQLSKIKWVFGLNYGMPVYERFIEDGVQMNSRFNSYLIFKF